MVKECEGKHFLGYANVGKHPETFPFRSSAASYGAPAGNWKRLQQGNRFRLVPFISSIFHLSILSAFFSLSLLTGARTKMGSSATSFPSNTRWIATVTGQRLPTLNHPRVSTLPSFFQLKTNQCGSNKRHQMYRLYNAVYNTTIALVATTNQKRYCYKIRNNK